MKFTAQDRRPHVIYFAVGFPPAAKSCTYRMRETANQLSAAGCDVTAVTICREAWDREYGIDLTLLDTLDPRVRVVELPLVREDLETDIRKFSEARSLRPLGWVTEHRQKALRDFPEPIFGAWRSAFEKALLRIDRDRPADLLLTTCVPYVGLAATWKLFQERRVPYAIDFRDGWSVDVINGGEAFAKDSVSGRWESKVLEHALAIWTVNDAIAEHYRARYPELADRVRIVRNGYDPDSVPERPHRPDPDAGLTFGYLGVMNLPVPLLKAALTGWKLARDADPLVARSRLQIRGQIGAGWAREDNAHMQALRAAAEDDVAFGGPVAKAEVASVYGQWDALLLMQPGGRFMTSGKVYEYMAAGLPIVSAHEPEHGASTVLADYPLWTGAVGLDPERIADSYREAARLAVTTSDAERDRIRAEARQWARDSQIEPVARELVGLIPDRRGALVGSGR